MWRMIRAAILGVLIGVVGGAIVGQNYYLNYLDNQKKDKAVSTFVYSNNEDSISTDKLSDVIRLEVCYKGAFELNSYEKQELTNTIREAAIGIIKRRLGNDYNSSMSVNDVKHEIIMAYEEINDYACKVASEYLVGCLNYNGESTCCDTSLEYKYYTETQYEGVELPAGFYETLMITVY